MKEVLEEENKERSLVSEGDGSWKNELSCKCCKEQGKSRGYLQMILKKKKKLARSLGLLSRVINWAETDARNEYQRLFSLQCLQN